MSVRRESILTLHCDESGCQAHSQFTGNTASDARIKAIRARWRVGRNKAMCGGCQDKHISSSGKPKKMRVKTQFSLHHGQIGVVISEEEHVIRIKFSDGKEELFGRSSVQEVQ